jgi:hypothetical protein
LTGAPVKTNGVAGVAAALGGAAGLVSGVAGLVSGVAGVAAALDGAEGLVSGDAGVAAAIAGVAGFFSGAAVVSCVAALRIQIVLQVLRPLMKKKKRFSRLIADEHQYRSTAALHNFEKIPNSDSFIVA